MNSRDEHDLVHGGRSRSREASATYRPMWQPRSRSPSRSCFRTPWSTLFPEPWYAESSQSSAQEPGSPAPGPQEPGSPAPGPAPSGRQADTQAPTHASISCFASTGRVGVVVRDNGCGLPEGFDIDQTRSLGLSIVSRSRPKSARWHDQDGDGWRHRCPPRYSGESTS